MSSGREKLATGDPQQINISLNGTKLDLKAFLILERCGFDFYYMPNG